MHRATKAAGAVVLVLALLPELGGCSIIGRADFEECKTNADCRATFGVGSVCGDDGLCGPAQSSARCQLTEPPDLFTRREKYQDAVVLGSLMDRSSATHQHREKSSRLAIMQVNEEGGIDGHEVAAIYCTYEANTQLDDLKAPDAALASAHYLADVAGVPAIFGPAGSADVSAVYQALRGTGVLVMSPSATSPA